jgi:aromatic-L-amino-acid/L-tryptophan decarboxylase
MASLAVAALNASVVSGDHADIHLERAVLGWLAELVGFAQAPGPACSPAAGPPRRSSASRARAVARWRRPAMTSVATASPRPAADRLRAGRGA